MTVTIRTYHREASPIARISLYFRFSALPITSRRSSRRVSYPLEIVLSACKSVVLFKKQTLNISPIIDADGKKCLFRGHVHVKFPTIRRAPCVLRWYKSSKRDIRVECPFLYKTPYIFPSRSSCTLAGHTISLIQLSISFLLHRVPFSSYATKPPTPLLALSLSLFLVLPSSTATALPSSLQLGSSVSL